MLLWVLCILAGLLLLLLYRSVNKYPDLPGAGIKLPLIGHYQVSTDLSFVTTRSALTSYWSLL